MKAQVTNRWLVSIFASVLVLQVTGCSTLGYYLQAIDGHARLMHRSQDIDGLLRQGTVDDPLRDKLQRVLEIRAFASRELALPDNGSYRAYAALERDAVAWALAATPEFSLDPLQWCYPIIGCASYRAYFDRQDAKREARRLGAEGRDVAVEPVPAYSTLGWFDDPLPSTVLNWPAPLLAGLIFHELAHQQLYVADDSAFNESFATAVERAGIRSWLEYSGDARALRDWEQRVQRDQAFLGLLRRARGRLEKLYGRALPVDELRALKRAEFLLLEQDYAALSADWGQGVQYDAWFERPPNNARLALIQTYEKWVPAFEVLLRRQDGDFAAFFRAARDLAELPPAQRESRLQVLESDVN